MAPPEDNQKSRDSMASMTSMTHGGTRNNNFGD
jgi:hypothetical protein